MATPNEDTKLGSWNFGGYSNARIGELLAMIQAELDDEKRQDLIDETNRIMHGEQAYAPF